jgi:acetolactate synthase-1/2/3 large subunit
MEISKAELLSAAQASALSQTPIEINGSDILVKSLQAEGVQFVWGYPGGAVLHIYDALYKPPIRCTLKDTSNPVNRII